MKLTGIEAMHLHMHNLMILSITIILLILLEIHYKYNTSLLKIKRTAMAEEDTERVSDNRQMFQFTKFKCTCRLLLILFDRQTFYRQYLYLSSLHLL